MFRGVFFNVDATTGTSARATTTTRKMHHFRLGRRNDDVTATIAICRSRHVSTVRKPAVSAPPRDRRSPRHRRSTADHRSCVVSSSVWIVRPTGTNRPYPCTTDKLSRIARRAVRLSRYSKPKIQNTRRRLDSPPALRTRKGLSSPRPCSSHEGEHWRARWSKVCRSTTMARPRAATGAGAGGVLQRRPHESPQLLAASCRSGPSRPELLDLRQVIRHDRRAAGEDVEDPVGHEPPGRASCPSGRSARRPRTDRPRKRGVLRPIVRDALAAGLRPANLRRRLAWPGRPGARRRRSPRQL